MLSANTINRVRRSLGQASVRNLLAAGVICCAVAAIFTGCDNKAKEKPVPPGPRKQVPEEGWQIESLLSEAAKVKGKLTAPYMLRFQRSDSPYAEFPRSLHVDFFKDSIPAGSPLKDSMVIESKMDAKYGKYLQNQNKVFLRDSVVVKNVLKGDTLRCKELWWDQSTQKFYTDKPVEIYTREKILFGNGMEADQNFRWYTIKHLTGSVLTTQSGNMK